MVECFPTKEEVAGSIPVARSMLLDLWNNLYGVNGLIFWSEREINARKIVESAHSSGNERQPEEYEPGVGVLSG
jgi:hypothetical protein